MTFHHIETAAQEASLHRLIDTTQSKADSAFSNGTLHEAHHSTISSHLAKATYHANIAHEHAKQGRTTDAIASTFSARNHAAAAALSYDSGVNHG